MIHWTETTGPSQSIAVVGGGVAGIVAAHLLSRQHHVTLFEKNKTLGGHTNTVVLEDGPDTGTAIDTGFIVTNNCTYPLFQTFLRNLDVPVRDSDMSFSYHCTCCGFQYAGGNWRGLIAKRRNAVDPRFWAMVTDILRFNQQAAYDLRNGLPLTTTLGDYIAQFRFHPWFRNRYLIPMSAAIWSTEPRQMLQYPARPFLEFFRNHGLLSVHKRLRWQTVQGGSHAYIKAFLKQFAGTVRTSASVQAIHRLPGAIAIVTEDGQTQTFDHIVLAAHADQAFRLLADPTPQEQAALAPWSYQKNRVILHTDPSVLPSRTSAWASWNFASDKHHDLPDSLSVTYYMNRLQGFRATRPYCVTLNPIAPIPEEHIIRDFIFDHPTYSAASIATQPKLAAINGMHNTWFCGSYIVSGFHEDAVRSAVQVARAFGIDFDADNTRSEECAACYAC